MDALTGAGGSTCAAYRYVNGSPTQIGNTFGVSYTAPSQNESKLGNQIIQFQGDLYAVTFDGVYKKNDPTVMTGDWTSQITFTNPNTSGPSGTGIHVIDVGGTPYLVTLWCDETDTDGARWAKFDGTTWTQATTPVDQGTTWVQTYDSIVYRNVLHVAPSAGNGPNFFTYDPSTDSIAVITGSGVGNNAYAAFCIFNDRLFQCSASTQSQNSIYEFAGGSWNRILALDVPIVFDTYDTAMVALFTDGTNMYRLCGAPNISFQGWRCYQIDGNLAQTDISAAKLPLNLRPTDEGGSWSGGNQDRHRFSAVYDVDTLPGTLKIYLYGAVNGTPGTGFSVYDWNDDPRALMLQIDSGGDVAHALPKGYPNNGERVWTAGELDIKITGRAAVLGGEQVSFIAHGGGTGRKMKLYYALQDEPVLAEATLAAPVTGGSATFNGGLNQVEGIAADGATVYTIVWDVQADALAGGQRARRIPQVFV
jgi:hypothetical protein